MFSQFNFSFPKTLTLVSLIEELKKRCNLMDRWHPKYDQLCQMLLDVQKVVSKENLQKVNG